MTTTIVVFAVLAISLYIALSYRAWQLKKGLLVAEEVKQKNTREMTRELSQKTEAILQSSARFTVYFATEVWRLSSNEVKSWVFRAFPRLKATFEQKDKLTGLYHGPASFYLANVSEYKAEFAKSAKRHRSIF